MVWKSAVESLKLAHKYLATSELARQFCETYAGPVVGILAEQAPAKIGPMERNCVQESFLHATLIVATDLSIQLARRLQQPQNQQQFLCGGESLLLESVLAQVFNKKKNFYKGHKGNGTVWQNNNNNNNAMANGFPDVRLRNIEKFRAASGFKLLRAYLMERITNSISSSSILGPSNMLLTSSSGISSTISSTGQKPAFPSLETIQHMLIALLDTIGTPLSVSGGSNNNNAMADGGTGTPDTAAAAEMHLAAQEEDAISISKAVMLYLQKLSEEEDYALKKIPTDLLITTLKSLQRIFDHLVNTRRTETMEFYAFWRNLVLVMITSPSLPLKLTGWEQVNELIKAGTDHRPPPRSFLCAGAGTTVCNGVYHFAGTVTADGYAKLGGEVFYVHTVPTILSSATATTSTGSSTPGTIHAPTSAPSAAATTISDNIATVPPELTRSTGPGLVVPNDTVMNSSSTTTNATSTPAKKLTLFRCTMRSQQKWWFLSEADEEQPGTDRDVDYYQHKSKEHEEAYPPPNEWITCRNAGLNPPPTLTPMGLMVPSGQQLETLEHLLAQWAIENEIVEQVLGDTTIHREVVARSTVLIKFLAYMCTRDKEGVFVGKHPIVNSSYGLVEGQKQKDDMSITSDEKTPSSVDSIVVDAAPANGKQPNQYCLKTSHLLFAWKTCTRKADAAVSLQVYQLLVSILPLCPSNLANPLLQAIQKSLHESSEKRDYLFEVSEFCSALAALNLVEVSNNNKAAAVPGTALTEDVREEVLNLLWSVLTHPGVSSLKSYESLKRYVTRELKVEPKGSEHRERFLHSCIKVLSVNVDQKSGCVVDEEQALRIVKLTRFILEACPRSQSHALVSAKSGAIPFLLFSELVASVERRNEQRTRRPRVQQPRRPSLTNTVGTNVSDVKSDVSSNALDERLRILRYVFGLSSPEHGTDSILMTASMINNLWTLCAQNPDDRASLMVFIASASHPGKAAVYERFGGPASLPTSPSSLVEPLLSAAFSEEVCRTVFLNLFCALSFDYDQIGEEGYRSFQFLFDGQFTSWSASRKIALNALWRLCLTAGNDVVASQAMKDLLGVYVRQQIAKRRIENGPLVQRDQQMMEDEDIDDNFGERMFEYLERVKAALEGRLPSAERSVERCMRILNAAIGRVESEGLPTNATLARLTALFGKNISLNDAVKCLPQGMRGQTCCRRIGIIAKRPQAQNKNTANFDSNAPRIPPTVRFSLDVHPLETLASIKYKVALNCQCTISAVKPIQINGRARGSHNDQSQMSLNVVSEDTVMDELGVVQGCEFVFVIAERAVQNNASGHSISTQRSSFSTDLSSFFFDDNGQFANRLFSVLMSILESLQWKEDPAGITDRNIGTSQSSKIHKLVWDLLLAMPMNESIASLVKSTHESLSSANSIQDTDNSMDIESKMARILDVSNFDRSVYALLTIDAFLQPSPEALSVFPPETRQDFEKAMNDEANHFRRIFVDTGGFGEVVRFFSVSGSDRKAGQVKTRRGNAVALRILKSCLFGSNSLLLDNIDSSSCQSDDTGMRLLQSLTDTSGLLKSLTSMVVEDSGISSQTVTDVLRFLRILFQAPNAAQCFVSLPDAERFLTILLMWDECPVTVKVSLSVSAALHVRRNAHDLILETPTLADNVLPWLTNAIESVDINSESTNEFFDVLEKLVADSRSSTRSKFASDNEFRGLASIVCKKLASCPQPGSEIDTNDISTGVLCGCLNLLRAIIEHAGGAVLRQGVNILLTDVGGERWSELNRRTRGDGLSLVSDALDRRPVEDLVLVDLMGSIFDGFLSPGGSSSVSICCDKESRGRGFEVVSAAARACQGADGYVALAYKMESLVVSAAPKLLHRWGQFSGVADSHSRNRVSKYSGLRNQGCTCYMNSVLQQLFMMPALRRSMCESPLPLSLRLVRSNAAAKGQELVGKKISLQWDTGVSFDAIVESFDKKTDMHTIRYCPIQIAAGPASRQQVHPDDVAKLPPMLPDEFVLSEGRVGKETGAFEIVPEATKMDSCEAKDPENITQIKESEDESMSRHLLEEVQRTFIHLEQGSRGHCFDPRALVEACACLKLEFDVWQQNDASEFTTKLLDRLEISLKKWAPENFRFMDHTFGLKQTKQKICRKCGLKSSREEKLLNIDCQIRGKSDIHEALSAMTEVEIMEGSNQVYCDKCKENTDTILKSAISTLPNVLILSLKRFDLDYNTFETVKLNSRCAFGQTLNMKQYSLDAIEVLEKAEKGKVIESDSSNTMELEENHIEATVIADDPLSCLPDENYEYRLVGVLVHAGVAQGGHYYSFIKDRLNGADEKWYRFDDEDVTPFDSALIEVECFGGKVKKETKWPNGQVHTVEQEQFANALMVFYEKVVLNDVPHVECETNEESEEKGNETNMETHESLETITSISGYAAFEPDVRKANDTHQWQSFLFDPELHIFLKGILLTCQTKKNDPSGENAIDSWRSVMLETLLSFVFDVMLYSDCVGINDWARLLEDILLKETEVSTSFVQKLARKASEISSNWLRTYIMECPDHSIRGAALRIFIAAMRSCTRSEFERKALTAWVRGWREQVAELHGPSSTSGEKLSAFPCVLVGKHSLLEEKQKIGTEVSSLGIILSFANVLLEAVPRYWRFSSELCQFVRFLASTSSENGEAILRRPMVDAQIPARIIALIARERSPSYLRNAFPGASAAVELANTQMRPETNPSAQIMPLIGNQVLNSTDLNNPRVPGQLDYVALLEALTCLAGISGTLHAQLVVRENEDIVRGRQWYSLTADAVKALSIIFHESCTQGSPGMGQREIETYLHRSGVDAGNVSTQKIMDMLSKYPTTGGTETERGMYLSLDGFIAYYRDCVQNNDLRLRIDLHAFGFRPDLTRRSHEARFFKIGERDTMCPPVQSVALDIAEMFQDRVVELGQLANFAIVNSNYLYSVAHEVCEPLMQYLLAAAAYRTKVDILIDRTLVNMYLSRNDWEGNKTVSGCSLMLQVLACSSCSPEEVDETVVINRIMTSATKATRNVDYGSGVLTVLRALHRARQTQQYNNEVHWTYSRYMHLLKELHTLYPIYKWMNDNRNLLGFIERELLDAHGAPHPPQNQTRNDYGSREQDTAISLDHNTNSDSDMGGMQDSEDDDDDSHFDNLDVSGNVGDGPLHIIIEGAGNEAVNGVYSQDGFFESAIRYVMDGCWNNERYKIYIFLCNVSNNTKHWYISIVPYGANPGTSSDIDFYTAPLTGKSMTVPPKIGWIKAGEGQNPPPVLSYRDHFDDADVSSSDQVVGSSTVVENDIDDDQAPQSPYE